MAEQHKPNVILLVEDSEDDYVLLRDLLEESDLNFELDWISSFEDAIAVINSGVCADVCLVDYQLGAHDGLELLREWRNHNCDAAFILLTGHEDHNVDVEASQLGATDFLVKGRFDAGDLERSIRYAIAQKKTQAALRDAARQNSRLAAAINSLNAGVFLTDPHRAGNPIIFHNNGLLRLTGLKSEDVMGRNFCLLPGFSLQDADIARLNEAFEKQEECEDVFQYQAYGKSWWCLLLFQPFYDDDGALLNYIGVLNDVSERVLAEHALRHYNHALHIASQCRRAVARTTTEDDLLHEVCGIIAQMGGHPLAWVGFKVGDEGMVRPLAWGGADEEKLKQIRLDWSDEEQGAGPAAEAIRSNQVQSIGDIAASDDAMAWRGAALRHGFASKLVLPLADNEGAFGVLCIYDDTPNAFDADETQLLSDLASDLSHGILSLRARSSRQRAEEALRTSEQKFRSLAEHSLDVISLLDVAGTILYTSASMDRVFGYAPELLQGSDIFELMHPEDEIRLHSEFEEVAVKPGAVAVFQGRLRHHDGSWRCIEGTQQNLLDDPVVQAVVFNMRDITERKEAELALRASERSYRSLIQVSPDAVLLLDRNGTVALANRQAVRTFGCEAEADLVGLSIANLVAPKDRQRADENRRRRMETSDTQFIEYSLLRRDGSLFSAEVTSAPAPGEDGEPMGLITVVRDITERKATEDQLLHNAFYDTLTDLPNRALFTERIKIALGRVQRHPDAQFAVMVLDIDRFKNVNDSLGHSYGDRLLLEVAARLQEALRAEDTIARLGGDEFAILIEETGGESAVLHAVERVHAQFTRPFQLDEHDVFMSASIGTTRSKADYESPDYMLRDADTAMYRAKWQGPGRHEIFDQAMHERVRSLLQVETDLRRAVEGIAEGRVEFLLHYQPIIALQTGRTEGFEALIRWRHPERGLVAPFDFISIAEETGLIVPIGEWVLREACRQTREWQKQFPSDPPLSINVNLSARQFLQLDLIGQIKDVLSETGIAPEELKLEITESVLMKNPDSAAATLVQLRDLGVKLSIDDFGTGYSSLAYLRRFPINGLKVDRSFVNNMSDNNEDMEIVRSIVALAHNLRLGVTAEGVENGSQLLQLRGLKCESSQGYFFSRPLEAEAASQLLQAAPNW